MVFAKVNQYHRDKLADRIAGAIIDHAYTLADNPHLIVDVEVGPGSTTVTAETTHHIDPRVIRAIVERITGKPKVEFRQNLRDPRPMAALGWCGETAVITAKWCPEYEYATGATVNLARSFPTGGQYDFDLANDAVRVNQPGVDLPTLFAHPEMAGLKVRVNVAGPGGATAKTGNSNHRLGSDQPTLGSGPLHGRDLSDPNVTVTIVANVVSKLFDGDPVTANCDIGSQNVAIKVANLPIRWTTYTELTTFAFNYIKQLGGFEQFAEHGFRWEPGM